MTSLIVTLILEDGAQAYFDALRRAHFPAERLVVGAHAALFHAIPGDEEPALAAMLDASARHSPRLPIMVSGLRFLGRGVAFDLESAPLHALRARLRAALHDRLTPRDRQVWKPRITVQDKASPDAARDLFVRLSRDFAPSAIIGTGLALWRYRDGPWEVAGRFPFTG
jgi:2'-5' RNA ligase superfamily